MKTYRLRVAEIIAGAVLAVLIAGVASAQYSAFPSGDGADGRFLGIVGYGQQSFVNEPVGIWFTVPADRSSFDIGVFDGDTGLDAGGNQNWQGGHWDKGYAKLAFALYEDPGKAASTATLVKMLDESAMADNAWYTDTIPVSASALNGDGTAYIYYMQVQTTVPANSDYSCFKVRSDAGVSVAPGAFAFLGAIFTDNDIGTIFPNFGSGDYSVLSYDGQWDFHFAAPDPLEMIHLWDGDFDFGMTGGPFDTDDPDTPPGAPPADPVNDPLPESAKGVGNPEEDKPNLAGIPPSVTYTITAPDGAEYLNANPSGNREWEKFTITTLPGMVPIVADYEAASLPAGLYCWRIDGLDLYNLSFIRSPYEVFSTPSAIGDYVWNDANEDGQQDDGEAGVAGVTVTLYDADGVALENQQTDASGYYLFDGLVSGSYSVGFSVPAGWALTVPDQGDDASDSDAALADGRTVTFLLPPAFTDRTRDAGLVEVPAGGGEGCTPGYWRQPHHFGNWVGYSPGDNYNQVFGVNDDPSLTLLDAVKRGGGGYKALGRHAVAALLNAAQADVSYLYSTADVIAMVQAAYASGEPEPTKNELVAQNEEGCPLGRAELAETSGDETAPAKRPKKGRGKGRKK